MSIKVGERIPSVTLHTMGTDGPEPVSSEEFASGRTVILFGVPGAFTPTCSNAHLPGFVKQAEAFKSLGVDEIACLSVNDAFVMGAWGAKQQVDGAVTLLADGSGQFIKAAGLELDLSGFGLGKRSQRFCMVVADGVVKDMAIEDEPPNAVQTGAEALLERWSDAYLHRGSAETGV